MYVIERVIIEPQRFDGTAQAHEREGREREREESESDDILLTVVH